MIFLHNNGIKSYDELVQKSSAVSVEYSARSEKIKKIDTRLKEIKELQKYIGQYGKTHDVFKKYTASGWDSDFYEIHRADIILHRAAKKYFDGLGLKKFPKMNELKQEYATLDSKKKKLYDGYNTMKKNSHELLKAKKNCESLLGIKSDTTERNNLRQKSL